MKRKRIYLLHYEYGVHHVYIKTSKEHIDKITEELSKEFIIHNDFNSQGEIECIWIENYYGDKHIICYGVDA